MASRPEKVSNYIASFPVPVRKLLKQLRSIIQSAAPGAEEVISYGMPAYKLHGMLVYFAGYGKHVGFYPTSSAIKAFRKELSAYKGSVGTVQFPLDKPLPAALITRMVKYRVEENLQKAEIKSKKLKPKN